jgi:hypothetical protein
MNLLIAKQNLKLGAVIATAWCCHCHSLVLSLVQLNIMETKLVGYLEYFI